MRFSQTQQKNFQRHTFGQLWLALVGDSAFLGMGPGYFAPEHTQRQQRRSDRY
jgi:hypothetical protein